MALVLSATLHQPHHLRDPDPGRAEGRNGADGLQLPLTLASDGVQSFVWQSRYGPMLIEVKGDQVFVNGQRVERAEP